jgi:hypothetical protein
VKRVSSLWKVVFAVFVLLPLLPAISVYSAVALAKIKACGVGDEEICVAGPISVARAIIGMTNVTLGLAVTFSVALIWLVVCYLSAILGWKRFASRLLVGLFATLIFAGYPYFASLPALGIFVEPECSLYGGVSASSVCGLFDGGVGAGAHILLIMVWLSIIGLPLGFAAFPLYILLILLAHTKPRPDLAQRIPERQ